MNFKQEFFNQKKIKMKYLMTSILFTLLLISSTNVFAGNNPVINPTPTFPIVPTEQTLIKNGCVTIYKPRIEGPELYDPMLWPYEVAYLNDVWKDCIPYPEKESDTTKDGVIVAMYVDTRDIICDPEFDLRDSRPDNVK